MKVRSVQADGGPLLVFQWAMFGILLMSAGCGADSPPSNGGVKVSNASPPAVNKPVATKPKGADPVAARKQLADLGVSYTVGDFIAAAVNGDQVAVTLFLDAGMDVNTRDHREYTALVAAATFGHRGIVEQLLARGADPALPGLALNALTMAVEADQLEIAAQLLDRGLQGKQAVVDVALSKAVTLGRAKLAGLLIKSGAAVNQVDENKGETLVMKAASRGFDDVLEVLLPVSTNINASSKAGFTAVDYACARINEENRQAESRTIEESYTLKRTSQHVQSDPSFKLLIDAGAKPITPIYVELRSEYLDRELQGALLESARAQAKGGTNLVPVQGNAAEILNSVTTDLKELGGTSTVLIAPWVSSCEAAGRARFTHSTTIHSTGPTDEERLTTTLLSFYQVELWSYAGTVISNAVAKENLKPDTMVFAKGETLLMKAVYSGDTNLVGLLVRAGADPRRKSQEGLSALSLATQLKSDAMLKIMNSGAKETKP